MIWFAALTGLRRGEMLALRPDQIRGDVLVLESTTKSGRPRGIPMPPRAARIAREHLPWGVPYWPATQALRRGQGCHWHGARALARPSAHIRLLARSERPSADGHP